MSPKQVAPDLGDHNFVIIMKNIFIKDFTFNYSSTFGENCIRFALYTKKIRYQATQVKI